MNDMSRMRMADTRVPRRANRDSLFLCATIRRRSDPEGDLPPVRLRNLSAVGLMADYDDVVDIGDPVVITCRGIGSVSGRVAWVKRGQIGVAFDYEVDPIKARRSVGGRTAPAVR
jgi:hypothetical protein